MKWAIVMYALLQYTTSNDMQEMISWNMPFQSHEVCEVFLKKNKETLKAGVLRHAEDLYQSDLIVREMGCALATVSADTPNSLPTISGRIPHYNGGVSL